MPKTMEEIRQAVEGPAYDFLRTDLRIAGRIMLLGLGGSYAYGTCVETSDIDVRGIALNTREEILTGRPFEQVIDNATDTTVYSFTKIVKLLTDANPNVLEMLFLEPEQYLKVTPEGEELIRNRSLFLSKRVLHTFGGYAAAQLNRLENLTVRDLDSRKQEEHILRSVQGAESSFPGKYFAYPEDAIRLYVDDAVNDGMETEIFMDVSLHHYPLRDYKCMWSEMHNVVKDYARIGKRAKSAINRDKLGKHGLHLYRLLSCACELLETGTMHTYRKDDRDLLMDIRQGKYTGEDGMMTPEFFRMVDEAEERMKKAAETTCLPDKPDYRRIDELVCRINGKIVAGTI